jgi:TorA maturation chaperone TorD
MELFRALAVLAEPPTEESTAVAEALGLSALPSAEEYTQLFVFELYPYASVYLGREGMLGGEALDRISGFWRAIGQVPPAESDHLSVMLAFYARLVDLEDEEGDPQRRASWRNSRKAFLWEHIVSWLPAYLAKVSNVAPPFYKKWAELLMAALIGEVGIVGPQESLSIHLGEAIGLLDPRNNSVDEFLQSILTPVRSGMILTRTDITAAARKLDVSLRMGERKFILKSLFAQDAPGVFAWLASKAQAWARRHRTYDPGLRDIAKAWEEKAMAAATLLSELQLAAADVI